MSAKFIAPKEQVVDPNCGGGPGCHPSSEGGGSCRGSKAAAVLRSGCSAGLSSGVLGTIDHLDDALRFFQISSAPSDGS